MCRVLTKFGQIVNGAKSIEDLEDRWVEFLVNFLFLLFEFFCTALPIRVKSYDVRQGIYVLFFFFYQVTSANVVNEIEHYQRDSKLELNLCQELCFIQECSFFFIFVNILSLFVNEKAKKSFLFLLSPELLCACNLHFFDALHSQIEPLFCLVAILCASYISSCNHFRSNHLGKSIFVSWAKLVVQIVWVNSDLSILLIVT